MTDIASEILIEKPKPKRNRPSPRPYVYYPVSAKRYNDKPEIKEKHKLYFAEYRQKEGYKEKKKMYNARFLEKQKLKKLQEKEQNQNETQTLETLD